MSRVEVVEVGEAGDAAPGLDRPAGGDGPVDGMSAGLGRRGDVPAQGTHVRRVARYVALVGAAALVAGLLAQSARNQTREAQIGELAGVVRTSGAGLRQLWTVERSQTEALLAGVVVGGTLVGPLQDEAGATVGVVGMDADTGRRLWTAQPPWDSADAGRPLWLQCARSGALATCLAEGALGYLAWSLEPATGRTVAVRQLPSEVATALVGGRVWVLAGFDTAGRPRLIWNEPDRLRMSALDMATGEAEWAWDGPTGFVGAPWSASIVGDGSLIRRGDSGWLIRSDGTVRTVAMDPVPGAYGAGRAAELFQTVFSSQAPGRLLTSSGTWREMPGTPLPLAVDDGSAPGLEFLHGDEAVAGAVLAVDGGSGEARWRLPGGAEQGVVLDGRLFVSAGGTLTALDASTGASLWTAQAAGQVVSMGTDGYAVLVASRQTVEAFALADGRPLWHTDVVTLLRGAGAQWAGERVLLDTGVPRVVVVRRDGSAVVLG